MDFLLPAGVQAPPHFVQVSHKGGVEVDLSHYSGDHGFYAQTIVIQGPKGDGTNYQLQPLWNRLLFTEIPRIHFGEGRWNRSKVIPRGT